MSVEPDNPPTTRIFVAMALLVLVVAAVLVGLFQLFKQQTRSLIYDKDLSLKSRALLEQQAKDQQRLEQYAELDRDEGRFQIPVERAMDKLLRRPGLLIEPPGVVPASQPASRPAAGAASPTRAGPASRPAPER